MSELAVGFVDLCFCKVFLASFSQITAGLVIVTCIVAVSVRSEFYKWGLLFWLEFLLKVLWFHLKKLQFELTIDIAVSL